MSMMPCLALLQGYGRSRSYRAVVQRQLLCCLWVAGGCMKGGPCGNACSVEAGCLLGLGIKWRIDRMELMQTAAVGMQVQV